MEYKLYQRQSSYKTTEYRSWEILIRILIINTLFTHYQSYNQVYSFFIICSFLYNSIEIFFIMRIIRLFLIG